MKNTLLIAIILNVCASAFSQSSAPVYLTFTTHNEDGEPYNLFNYYIARRNFIKQLADSVADKKIRWNFQSDWRFLQAVKNFDTGSVILNTNGKNIIRWLVEDRGIVCDPHSHEANGYNYADVAYLHEQLGINPTKTVGGFIYNQIIGGNNWENLENGIYGRVYTSYFWKPDILWGGGTPGHVNDPQNYGVWKPQSMANFYVHDSTKHLTLVGNGCNNKIFDTTLVTTAVGRIRNLVDAIRYHAFPDTGIYTATVHTQIAQLNIAQILKIMQFIDSMETFVADGKVIWKNIGEIYGIWNSTYSKKPFWIGCSQLPDTYSYLNIKVIPEGFFQSPFTILNIEDTLRVMLRNSFSPYSIVDSSAAIIDSVLFTGNFVFFRAGTGSYYAELKHRNALKTWSKVGGISFTQGSVMNYDFTSSAAQAFGNNQTLKGSQYCIYSGDVNGDDIIDISDIVSIFSDAAAFTSGYVNTDLTGDNQTDVSDMQIAFNNSADFVTTKSP